MKKNFNLTGTSHRPDRQVEMIKGDINKYLARERRKALPEGVDFWDFDCKCGANEASAQVTTVKDIGKKIDEVYNAKSDTVYVEILAKPGHRSKLFKNKSRRHEDDEE